MTVTICFVFTKNGLKHTFFNQKKLQDAENYKI